MKLKTITEDEFEDLDSEDTFSNEIEDTIAITIVTKTPNEDNIINQIAQIGAEINDEPVLPLQRLYPKNDHNSWGLIWGVYDILETYNWNPLKEPLYYFQVEIYLDNNTINVLEKLIEPHPTWITDAKTLLNSDFIQEYFDLPRKYN